MRCFRSLSEISSPKAMTWHLFVNFFPLDATAKSLQSCPTLCDPIDGSPPGSAVTGILQARTLEWVAISFSNAWKWNMQVKSLSHVWLLATPWTAAYQDPPSMGFSRQEYWSGVPSPSLFLPLTPSKIVHIWEIVSHWVRAIYPPKSHKLKNIFSFFVSAKCNILALICFIL